MEPRGLGGVSYGGIQLLTHDGRLLDLRFSDRELRHANDVAQVEVTGDPPSSPAEWRGGSTVEPIRAAARHSPNAASGRSEKSASISARRRRVSA